LHFTAEQQSMVRWRGADLDQLNPKVLDEADALLTELEAFSGLIFGTDPSPWTGVKLADGAIVQRTIDALRRLVNECWPALQMNLSAVIADSKAPGPNTLDELGSLVGLLNGINNTLRCFEATIFEQDLEALKVALEPAKNRLSAILTWCSNGKYRQARRLIRELNHNGEKSTRTLLNAVVISAAQLRRWNSLAPGRCPITCDGLPDLRAALDRTVAELETLTPVLDRGDLRHHSIDALQSLCRKLAADSVIPFRLPRLTEIERKLSEPWDSCYSRRA
jgi:hypothetical protein